MSYPNPNKKKKILAGLGSGAVGEGQLFLDKGTRDKDKDKGPGTQKKWIGCPGSWRETAEPRLTGPLVVRHATPEPEEKERTKKKNRVLCTPQNSIHSLVLSGFR